VAKSELPSFRVGSQSYRIHDPKHGAIAGDATALTGKDAQQVLDQLATIKELAWVLPRLREAVAGQGLVLLRLRSSVPGATTAPSPAPEPSPAAPPAPRKQPKSWIEIEVVDDEGKPRAGCGYRLDLPDGRTFQGKLAGNGTISVHGIDPGTATLTLIEST
jgi:hypothetical protein